MFMNTRIDEYMYSDTYIYIMVLLKEQMRKMQISFDFKDLG